MPAGKGSLANLSSGSIYNKRKGSPGTLNPGGRMIPARTPSRSGVRYMNRKTGRG